MRMDECAIMWQAPVLSRTPTRSRRSCRRLRPTHQHTRTPQQGAACAHGQCSCVGRYAEQTVRDTYAMQDVKARIAKMNSQVGDGAAPAADAGTPTEPPTEGAILLEGAAVCATGFIFVPVWTVARGGATRVRCSEKTGRLACTVQA